MLNGTWTYMWFFMVGIDQENAKIHCNQAANRHDKTHAFKELLTKVHNNFQPTMNHCAICFSIWWLFFPKLSIWSSLQILWSLHLWCHPPVLLLLNLNILPGLNPDFFGGVAIYFATRTVGVEAVAGIRHTTSESSQIESAGSNSKHIDKNG